MHLQDLKLGLRKSFLYLTESHSDLNYIVMFVYENKINSK